MNHYHCAMQQNAFATSDDDWTPAAAAAAAAAVMVDRRHPVYYPKPRRLTQLSGAAEPFRPLRWQASYQEEPSDSKAGAELLDIFVSKGAELNSRASSPPLFCGSPPTRSANPVIHDLRFFEVRPVGPISPSPATVVAHGQSPMSPSRKSCSPAKFGLKPAAVRIEGFDCQRRSRSISAVA